MNEKFNMNGIDSLIGRHLIIEVTVRDYDETLVERRQLHGNVIRVSEGEGIVVRLEPSGNEYMLPPDLDEFEVLPPGRYTLESTGEWIENPDLATSLLVHLPPPDYEGPDLSKRAEESAAEEES